MGGWQAMLCGPQGNNGRIGQGWNGMDGPGRRDGCPVQTKEE